MRPMVVYPSELGPNSCVNNGRKPARGTGAFDVKERDEERVENPSGKPARASGAV